jgi:hypothetical protein
MADPINRIAHPSPIAGGSSPEYPQLAEILERLLTGSSTVVLRQQMIAAAREFDTQMNDRRKQAIQIPQVVT